MDSARDYRKIILFRALQLGDLLCAVPALRALRGRFPMARITLVGLPWAQEFRSRFPRYIDEFVEFPGFPGLPERNPAALQRFPEFLRNVRALNADLAIQAHGSGVITNPLVQLFGARDYAGFYQPGQFQPVGVFIPYPAPEPETWKLLRLAAALGATDLEESLEFETGAEDRELLAELPEAARLEGSPYVCIHPGARLAARRWPLERFARVADALADRGLRVAITGSSAERPLAEKIMRETRAECVDMTGRTSLGSLAALLQGSRMLICNDTGVSHLAAALRIPSVVVLHASEKECWPPADRRLHRVLSRIGGVRSQDVLQGVDAVLLETVQRQDRPRLSAVA